MKYLSVLFSLLLSFLVSPAQIYDDYDEYEPFDIINDIHLRPLYPDSKEVIVIDPAQETGMDTYSVYYNNFIVPKVLVDKDGVELTPIAIWDQCCNNIPLTKIIIPASVRHIGSYCFNYCNIGTLELSEGLNSISGHSFSNLSGIQTVSFPATMYEIGEACFSNTDLTSVEFGAGLRKIGEESFCNNPLLEHVTLPERLTDLGKLCFNNLTILTSLSLPKWLKAMSGCFNGCSSLGKIECHSCIPPVIYDCFNEVNFDQCIVTVPLGCKGNYLQSPVFNKFKNIIECEESGVWETSDSESNSDVVNVSVDIQGYPTHPDSPGIHLIKEEGEYHKILVPRH
ncbi:MAG: leucine-rich repeat domain-containing protein [Muribaculaceae bacterium]|nr:leucine-rich repeat domain-containing protein [Muribaculaceae bacterium]